MFMSVTPVKNTQVLLATCYLLEHSKLLISDSLPIFLWFVTYVLVRQYQLDTSVQDVVVQSGP